MPVVGLAGSVQAHPDADIVPVQDVQHRIREESAVGLHPQIDSRADGAAQFRGDRVDMIWTSQQRLASVQDHLDMRQLVILDMVGDTACGDS